MSDQLASTEFARSGQMTPSAQLALLIDAVDEYAIFLLDVHGRVSSWNVGAQRIKGYKADEILGQHFSVFYSPEEVLAGKPERELAAAAKEGHCNDEGWRIRKDGTRFWANVVITALHDEDGELVGFAKVTHDESDRKAADEHVRLLELMADRERIARGMTDTIVHRVFEAGLAIHGVLRLVKDPVAVERLKEAIELHDQTIKDIRNLVIGLQRQSPPSDPLG